eukprot:SAG31_NODE_6471_length_2004_cov_5.374278_1_plen_397_part_00
MLSASASMGRGRALSMTKGVMTPRSVSFSPSEFSTPGTDVGASTKGVDAADDLQHLLVGSSTRVIERRRFNDYFGTKFTPMIDKILDKAFVNEEVKVSFEDTSGYGPPSTNLEQHLREISLDIAAAATECMSDELFDYSHDLAKDFGRHVIATHTGSDSDTVLPRDHFVILDTVMNTLETIGTELEKTRGAITTLVSRKKKLTADLIEFWTDVGDDVTEILENSESVDEESTPKPGSKAIRHDKIQTEVDKIDTQIKSLQSHVHALRGAIKATLANHYNTPEYDWNSEPKKLQALTLDPKLAGSPDPTLVDSFLVSIRGLLHNHVSLFWTCIPYLECMDSDREYAEHWSFPCEANKYDGVPKHLVDIYKSQSAILFQHIWSSSESERKETNNNGIS